MSRTKPSVVRVAMAKRLAEMWLTRNSTPEFRISVLESPILANLPRALRAFRDGKTRLGSVSPIPDLGMKMGSSHLEIWSSDREALVQLDRWLTSSGFETTGIW